MPLPGRVVEGRRTRAALFTRPIKNLAAWAALLGSLAGCGGTEPRIPTTLNLNSNSVAFTSLGQTQQLSPSIADQDGNPLQDASVTWSSSNEEVASVTQDGVVAAEGRGTATITATAGSASATAQVTVVQTPAQLEKISGDVQTVTAGELLGAPLVVQVNDALGHPIPGAVVNFAVSAGGGRVSSPVSTTGADGRASTLVTVGTGAGLPQGISARLPNTTISASFTATAEALPSTYTIEIQYLTAATPAQEEAFTEARLRWESVIFGDVEDGLLQTSAGDCGADSPAVDRIIDDVLILVSLEPIDGPGGVLAGAGPCYIRDPGDLTILGTMFFDTDDLAMLEADGFLTDVVRHEMGHVLGFGTLWSFQGLLAGASLPPDNGTDPHFTGNQGREAFELTGGATYTAGLKVPVENTGGEGTADSHWRESVFDNELMTGFIGAGVNPLSIVTLASLADQGYLVNLAGADTYSLVQALRAFGSQPKLQLKNDIVRRPVRKVDSRGRITGMLR